MKICPKCNIPHNLNGKFCSRSCSNSRSFSDESKAKKSAAQKANWNKRSKEEQRKQINTLLAACPQAPQIHFDRLLNGDWDKKGYDAKRLTVILEQKACCNRCGISHWEGERITLEFEHKDGNNQNNERSNVEALCPNCHSLTDTWRGRNNRKKQKVVEKYIDMLDSSNGKARP